MYLIEILHQTTTYGIARSRGGWLYLIEILHQTTTCLAQTSSTTRCILSKFYIKPQLPAARLFSNAVVSYRNSTSNHNVAGAKIKRDFVVSYRNSTSNHNIEAVLLDCIGVVSYRNSTSNHNKGRCCTNPTPLYLIEILHQTTTNKSTGLTPSALYLIEILHQTTTINQITVNTWELYLIEILHQTTTPFFIYCFLCRCILSKFYIKPQHRASY